MKKEQSSSNLIKKSTLNTIMGLRGETMDFMIDLSFYADKLNKHNKRILKKQLKTLVSNNYNNDLNSFIQAINCSDDINKLIRELYYGNENDDKSEN